MSAFPKSRPTSASSQGNIRSDPRLEARGIARAMERADWRSKARKYDGAIYQGWQGPVYQLDGSVLHGTDGAPVEVWKNASKEGPHDLWTNKPQGLKPLLLPPKSIAQFIAPAGGLVYGAEGVADTFSLWSAGVGNAFGLYGTPFVPDTLAADLLAVGATRLYFYCHPDAIEKVGQKIIDSLADSGIEVVIFSLLLDEEGHKIDLNDLWKLARFDKGIFWASVAQLPRLDLRPQPKPQRAAAPHRQITGDDRTGLRAWADKALTNVAAELSHQVGNRNDALYVKARRLGSISAHGLLDRTDCERALEESCTTNGYLTEHSPKAFEATFKSGFDDGLAEPCDLPDSPPPGGLDFTRLVDMATIPSNSSLDGAATTDTVAQPTPSTWGPTLHDSLDRNLIRFYGKAGPRVAQTARAMIEWGSSPFTIDELAEHSGIPRKKIYRALEDSGLADLLDRLTRLDPDHIDKKDPKESQCQSDLIQSGSQKPAQLYQLLPYPEAVKNFLEKVVSPRLVEQYYKLPDGYLPKVTEALLKALDADPASVDQINERLDATLPEAQRRHNKEAYNLAAKEFGLIARDLQDLTITELPQTAVGKDWKKDYAGALITREVAPALGKEQLPLGDVMRNTGLSRSTVIRSYKRAGIANDAQFTSEVIDRVEALPDPGKYYSDKQGSPAKAVFEDGTTLDYRAAKTQRTVAQAISAGGKVRIDFQQAGIPRLMTPDELEVKKPAPKKQEEAAQPNNKGATDKPWILPGHDPKYARNAAICWLKALGYNQQDRRIILDGEIVSYKEFRELNGRELGSLLIGKTLISLKTPDVLLRYGIPVQTDLRMTKLYAAYIIASQRGESDPFLRALDEQTHQALLAYADDEPAPDEVFILGEIIL